jgi:LysR family transcriptional regulator, hydrogen peroxide-inducible genes activator
MVAANMGVTLLPQLATDGGISQVAPITLVPLATPSSRHIGLVWRRSTHRESEFKLLGEELTP